jgi:hypothetical protein
VKGFEEAVTRCEQASEQVFRLIDFSNTVNLYACLLSRSLANEMRCLY